MYKIFKILLISLIIFPSISDANESKDFCSITAEQVLSELKIIYSNLDQDLRAFSMDEVNIQIANSSYFNNLSDALIAKVRKSNIDSLISTFNIKNEKMDIRLNNCSFISSLQMNQYGEELNVRWKKELKTHAFFGEDANVVVISPFVVNLISKFSAQNSELPLGIISAHECFHGIESGNQWANADFESDYSKMKIALSEFYPGNNLSNWDEDKSDLAGVQFAIWWLQEQSLETAVKIRNNPVQMLFSFAYWVGSKDNSVGRHSEDSVRINRFLRSSKLRQIMGCTSNH